MIENEPTNQTIEYHLQEAISHLEKALDQSIAFIQQNESMKKSIGQSWEGFLGQFFGSIREKGKKARINLLSLITFPRLR